METRYIVIAILIGITANLIASYLYDRWKGTI